MTSQRPPGNVAALKTAVPGPSSMDEKRRHKRSASPQVTLTFLGIDHVAVNWSLGGVLVEDPRHLDLAIGTKVEGVATVRGYEGRIRFSAELVRRDKRTEEIAFRFLEPSRALLDALSRVAD